MERKKKLGYEDMKKIVGAKVEKLDEFWLVYDADKQRKIGIYKNYEFAKLADELYKIDESISPFGWIPS